MPSAPVIVLVAAFSSVAGFLVVSRFVPDRWLVADPDAASSLYAVIGMAYAILVALGAIAVWEPRSEAVQSTDLEATNLVEAYWSTRVLPEPDRTAVQNLIISYAEEVVEREWPVLRVRRTSSQGAEDLMTQLRLRVEAVDPEQEQVVERVAAVAEARRARISAADEGMPQPMWPILIGGGIVSVAFLYLFGMARTFPNGLMLFVVGGMVALLLAVIYQLEFPFSRGLGVSSEPFQDALTRLNTLP